MRRVLVEFMQWAKRNRCVLAEVSSRRGQASRSPWAPALAFAATCALCLPAPLLAADEESGAGRDGEAAPTGAGPSAAEATPSASETTGLLLQDRIKAVSRKVFVKEGRFELAPFTGFSTNDAFFRRWTLGSRASYHLQDSFSLDVGGAWNVISEKLDSVRVVGEALSAIPDQATLYGYADAGVTFAPVYGKVSLLSESVIHFDGFVSGGLGAVFTSDQDGIQPTMQLGVGTRIFLNRWVVLRADLRDYIYPQERSGFSTLQNLLMLTLGVGFYYPLDFEYKYQAARISG